MIAVRSSAASTRVVTLAKRGVTIPTGTQKTISLSLNATGQALLTRFHTLPARLTVRLTTTAKPTVLFSKALVFKQRKGR